MAFSLVESLRNCAGVFLMPWLWDVHRTWHTAHGLLGHAHRSISWILSWGPAALLQTWRRRRV